MLELTTLEWGLIGISLLAVVEFMFLIFVWRELGTKLKVALNRGKIIKVILYTPAKSVQVIYTKLDDLGMIRTPNGEPFTVDKDFFFMDEQYAIPIITYKQDHPAPIDPFLMKSSKIDPSLIEGLLFRVQAYTQKKAVKDAKYGYYTMLIAGITLAAVIIGMYMLYTGQQDITALLAPAVNAARSVVLK